MSSTPNAFNNPCESSFNDNLNLSVYDGGIAEGRPEIACEYLVERCESTQPHRPRERAALIVSAMKTWVSMKSSTLPHPPWGSGPLTPLLYPLFAEHSVSARNCLAWPDRARDGFVTPMHDTPPCCTACRKVLCLPAARRGS